MALIELKIVVPEEYAEQAKKYTLEAIEIMMREAAQKTVETTVQPVIEELKQANIEKPQTVETVEETPITEEVIETKELPVEEKLTETKITESI